MWDCYISAHKRMCAARTPLFPFVLFHKNLSELRDTRVSPSQTGHKQATSIFKYKLFNTCFQTLHNQSVSFPQQTFKYLAKSQKKKADL